MALFSLFTGRARPRQVLRRQQRGLLLPPLSPLVCVVVIILTAVVMVLLFLLGTAKLLRYRTLTQKPLVLVREEMVGRKNHTAVLKTLPEFEAHKVRAGEAESNWKPVPPPTPSLPHPVQGPAPLPSSSHQSPLQLQMMTRNSSSSSSSNNIVMGPYHNWELFSADYQEMLLNLKIFVYPDVHSSSSSSSKANRKSSSQAPNYDSVFLPLANPTNPKLGNYYSEHAFKVALLHSSLVTESPEEANFFFMPFSINAMRNHPLLHSASSISDFIAQYTTRISSDFTFWNASAGADHFYVCCHSIGRDAASKHPALHNNAIQVTCSSSYFQRLYITHKDIGLPQVWPRQHDDGGRRPFNPPAARNILAFFAGRAQNSLIRQKLLDLWSNDTSFAISSGGLSLPYEEGFKRSKYCLHVKGYEVNTARVSDAIHYGCIPVIISNYYDLPFASVIDWSKFSIIVSEKDIHVLKEILLSVSKETYLKLYKSLSLVRRHFAWHSTPRSYDAFYMTAYQLWLKRGLQRIA